MMIQHDESIHNEKKDLQENIVIDCTDDIVHNETLDRIKKTYAAYIADPKCVYKLCKNEWLIILQSLPSTRTNAGRSNIKHQKYAKCRADILKVLKIVNIDDENTIERYDHQRASSTSHDNTIITNLTTYIVNENVQPDSFDDDLEKVCTNGIHYFESIDRAFLYRTRLRDYTGTWITWQDNGLKYQKCTYVRNKPEGLFTQWFDDNGIKEFEGMFLNNLKDGIWLQWDVNGEKICESRYVRNVLHGKITQWYVHCNKRIAREGYYIHGIAYDKMICD
jgi:antitoxin component YwqK of YwqJK toxin-antitoxin module